MRPELLSEQGSSSAIGHHPVELARRVNLILDAIRPEPSVDMSLSWITDLLTGSGHAITAQWWNNLLDGIPNAVSRPQVLKCIAQQANVDPRYLTHSNPSCDDRFEAELELIAALRQTGSLLSPESSGGTDVNALRRLAASLRQASSILTRVGESPESDHGQSNAYLQSRTATVAAP